MTPRTLRRWRAVHTWSSLVCTLFMLLLAVTGLPLIFHHEIDHWTGSDMEAPERAHGGPRASIDQVIASAQAQHPGLHVQFVGPDEDDDRLMFVTLAPTLTPSNDFKQVVVDARTAEVLGSPDVTSGFMYWMLRLHVDLFAELPGKLFLGLMALLLLVALLSGAVLYAPFMRKLDFGTVRRERSQRLKWLDLHNLIGIVTLAWFTVVGATGMLNTWADLLVRHWQQEQLSALLAPYRGKPLVAAGDRTPLQPAWERARAASPGTELAFIAMPGTSFSSPHHATFLMRGQTPLTSRLLWPVLIDAQDGHVFATPELPWYLKALLLSQPLHFGDYGGLPLKLIWALLDGLTIAVLGSGLYLWVARRRMARGEGADPEAARWGSALGKRMSGKWRANSRTERPSQRRSDAKVWGAPIAAAAVSAVGLVCGLLADGPWDALSWATLGGVAALAGWLSLRRPSPPGR